MTNERYAEVVVIDKGGIVLNSNDSKGRLIQSFYSALAGVTFEGRQSLLKNLYAGQELVLRRMPNHPYDSNAIAVYDSNSMQQVGFIRKYVAANLAPIMDRDDRIVRCTVEEVTGGGDRYLGINILIEIYECRRDTNSYYEKVQITRNNENPFNVRTAYLSMDNEGNLQITSNPRDNGPADNFIFKNLEDVINSEFYNQNNTEITHNREVSYAKNPLPKNKPTYTKNNINYYYEDEGSEDDSDIPEQELDFRGTGAPFL